MTTKKRGKFLFDQKDINIISMIHLIPTVLQLYGCDFTADNLVVIIIVSSIFLKIEGNKEKRKY